MCEIEIPKTNELTLNEQIQNASQDPIVLTKNQRIKNHKSTIVE